MIPVAETLFYQWTTAILLVAALSWVGVFAVLAFRTRHGGIKRGL